MAATNAVEFVVNDAAVVVDDVSMTYKLGRHTKEPGKGSLWRSKGNVESVQPPREVHALDPLSLIVRHGESVGVIGRNGSGKSTLMKLIAGHQVPTTGTIHASATPVLLGVNAALIPDLTGAQNIWLGCLALGMSKEAIRGKFDSIVDLAGLKHAIGRPLKTYSSGMASRLQFSIAASIDPEILVLDEAMNTGDAEFSAKTRVRFEELLEQAGTVFLVSHGMGTVKELCTRVLWIDDGELLADGDPEKITTLYGKFIWHLRRNDDSSAARVKRAALKDFEEVRISERTSGRRRLDTA